MITVERATLTDKQKLNDLIHRQFIEHEIICAVDVLDSAVEEILVREGLGLFLVARERNQIIGFAAVSFAWTLEHGGKSAWLDELYVLPAHRGKGVGSMLLEKVIEEVSSEGCGAIDLEVDQDHRQAERLYQRKGFEQLRRSRWVKQLP